MPATSPVELTRRAYQPEDGERIRAWLQRTLRENAWRQINWPLYRWDYWIWHVNANIFQFPLEKVVDLWETPAGELAALLHPDGAGEAFLQAAPAYRTPALLAEMLARAEANLATPAGLRTWVMADDDALAQVLTERGFVRRELAEYQRWRTVTAAPPPAPVPPGFEVRALGGLEELPARSWASWRAFHPDDPDERYEGWEWYLNVQRAPLYRRDLDLVAVAPDGAIAAFTTVWWDPATGVGAFEPVGAPPEYQRRGLARALMTEGLRRLHALGATRAYVSSYSPAAHATYAAAGFTDYDLSVLWTRAR